MIRPPCSVIFVVALLSQLLLSQSSCGATVAQNAIVLRAEPAATICARMLLRLILDMVGLFLVIGHCALKRLQARELPRQSP
jgi:hypothetical protein